MAAAALRPPRKALTELDAIRARPCGDARPTSATLLPIHDPRFVALPPIRGSASQFVTPGAESWAYRAGQRHGIRSGCHKWGRERAGRGTAYEVGVTSGDWPGQEVLNVRTWRHKWGNGRSVAVRAAGADRAAGAGAAQGRCPRGHRVAVVIEMRQSRRDPVHHIADDRQRDVPHPVQFDVAHG